MARKAKRARSSALMVTEGEGAGAFPAQRPLPAVINDLLDVLCRYAAFSPDWFRGAVRADNTEWQWRMIQLMISNGTDAAKKDGPASDAIHPQYI